MDTVHFLTFAAQGDFARQLKSMLWTAYGTPIKFLLGALLIIGLVVFLAGFFSKLTR